MSWVGSSTSTAAPPDVFPAGTTLCAALPLWWPKPLIGTVWHAGGQAEDSTRAGDVAAAGSDRVRGPDRRPNRVRLHQP